MKRSTLSMLSVLALAIVAGLLTSTVATNAQDRGLPRFVRVRNGDLNGDGVRDISDMIAGLQWLFNGGSAPVNPEGDDPAADRIASIQERARSIVANLPTPAQIAKLPRRFQAGFLKVRHVFTAAIANAQEWTPKDVRHYADAVSWVGVYLSTAAVALSEIRPQVLDPDCVPKCVAAHDDCMSGCPSGEVVVDDEDFDLSDTYMDCKMECDLNLADCIARCGNWSAL